MEIFKYYFWLKPTFHINTFVWHPMANMLLNIHLHSFLDRSFMVDPLSYFSFQPVLSCLWDSEYKRSLAANRKGNVLFNDKLNTLMGKSRPCSGGSRFPLLLRSPLPYVRRHITIHKMCWVCCEIKHYLLSLYFCVCVCVCVWFHYMHV